MPSSSGDAEDPRADGFSDSEGESTESNKSVSKLQMPPRGASSEVYEKVSILRVLHDQSLLIFRRSYGRLRNLSIP